MAKTKHILSENELSAFCEQISMIISAGLPIYYGVSILRDEACDEETKSLLDEIYTPMEAGATLHTALSDTGVFPDYMLNMVQLGEETGRLEDVLSSLSVYYERESEIKKGIKNAITYPNVMTFLLIAVMFVLIIKVLPVFSQIYEDLGTELTGMAAILLSCSNALNKSILVIIAVFVAIVIACFILYKTNLGKALFNGTPLLMAISASRFANCMYLALASGLDTNHGLDLAEELVDNPHMEERIVKCRKHISEGEGLAESLLLSNIFSRIYGGWINIGFKTGGMDSVMKRIGDAYNDEIDHRIHRFVSILEPTLVIILSIFIGLILISFLLPLLGIMSSIG